jgi:predicted dinucleotide-binding enzyme
MKVAVLGTGLVGDTIGSKLIELGHTVIMGSGNTGNEKEKRLLRNTVARPVPEHLQRPQHRVISFLIAEEKRILKRKRILILNR